MAAALLEKNERTLRRWCTDGVLAVACTDAQGKTMFEIDTILALCEELKVADDEMYELISAADHGSAEAQNDLATLLLKAGKQASALSLFNMAADQDYPDAMHFLYQCHQQGMGTAANDALAMMWLSKAASHGHKIAHLQLRGIQELAEQALQTSAQ
jgi:hypothetical protein